MIAVQGRLKGFLGALQNVSGAFQRRSRGISGAFQIDDWDFKGGFIGYGGSRDVLSHFRGVSSGSKGFFF